jgi:protease I
LEVNMAELSHLRVAVVATDYFEESELLEPLHAISEAGARVDVIAPKIGEIQAMRHADKGTTVKVEPNAQGAPPEEYNALVLPGGALNADVLRMIPEARAFVVKMQNAGQTHRCHLPCALAARLRGSRSRQEAHQLLHPPRRYPERRRSLAGPGSGRGWQRVTSRQPKDLPAFINAAVSLFSGAPPIRAVSSAPAAPA